MNRYPGSKEIVFGRHLAQYNFRWSENLGANAPKNSGKAGIDLQSYLAQSNTTRRLDVTLPWGSVLPVFVHWGDHTDLDLLDVKIASGKPYFEDFDGAVVATDTPTECKNCHRRFMTLTLEHSVTPVADMVPRYRTHAYIEHCPNCGTKWRADIVEIISSTDSIGVMEITS